MISQELEIALHESFVEARSKRHEYITVEHLLVGLLDTPAVAQALRACGAHLDVLREHLALHITQQTPIVAGNREVDTPKIITTLDRNFRGLVVTLAPNSGVAVLDGE